MKLKKITLLAGPTLKTGSLTKYLLIEIDLIYPALWVDLQSFKYFEMSFKLK